jgi:elongation factor P--(R)-beta-lysine ligase
MNATLDQGDGGVEQGAMDRSHVPARRILEARKRMNDVIRRFFDERGLLEVETPIAVVSPGLEPHLFAFETKEIGPDARAETLYLHTSPEYAMKRMLGRGLGSIYQLARVFRNGERSRTHAPEFTMLEWYRQPGKLGEIIDDAAALIAEVARAVGGPWRPARVDRLSVSEAFSRVGLGDPLAFDDAAELARALRVSPRAGDSWDDVFFRAFLDRVEPTFAGDAVTILHGYPARMAALARLDRADPRRAERFEVYVGSLEIANAFGELTDAVEQRRRFEEDLAVRGELGRPMYPIDEGFLADLGRLGELGEAAGIALGADRLLMLCLGLSAVQDVIAFSPREAS